MFPEPTFTSANIGTVHDPVNRACPPQVAVIICVFVYAVATVARSVPSVVLLATSDELEGELAGLAATLVRLNGEQPTKFGAVEFTAAHS